MYTYNKEYHARIQQTKQKKLVYVYILPNAWLPATTFFVAPKGVLSDSWKEICTAATA